jgi:hypothetical protein
MRLTSPASSPSDPRIGERVDQDLAEGLLWPEPSIGLNPSFAKGGWIDDVVAEGVLHSQRVASFASRGAKTTGLTSSLARMNIQTVRTAARSPWQKAYASPRTS